MQLLEDVPSHWGFGEKHTEVSQGKLVELTVSDQSSHHTGCFCGKSRDCLREDWRPANKREHVTTSPAQRAEKCSARLKDAASPGVQPQ